MPKHFFDFPKDIKQAVKLYIDQKIKEIDSGRFRQEPAYVASLFSRIEGVAYQSPEGVIKFKATIVDDRGPGAAEKRTGADFVLTADISVNTNRIQKAIVGQAKLNSIDSLTPKQRSKLCEQIRLMRSELKYKYPKVMEIIEVDGFRQPRILSGINFLMGESYKSVLFSDYIVDRVLTTLDGNTNSNFVQRVQSSSLSLPRLHIKARLGKKRLNASTPESNRKSDVESVKQTELFSDFFEDPEFLAFDRDIGT